MDIRDARVWCEIDTAQLTANIRALGELTGGTERIAPVVKANAYGHDTLLAAEAFAAAGVQWLCVDSIDEGILLREAGFEHRILVLGHVPLGRLDELVRLRLSCVVYDPATVEELGRASARAGRDAAVHVKVETGNNRQGLLTPEVLELAGLILRTPGVELEGIGTHFADIEDTTDHRFAQSQLARFRETAEELGRAGHRPAWLHCANSAATILWPQAHLDLARVGIASYGMWPSRETYITALMEHRNRIPLAPSLTWKARIAQVKTVAPGESVGYGRSYLVTHETRIAVLPVGYYEGYDRGLSNTAFALVRGRRAPVRGRVCMNMTMIDVTDVPGAAAGDEVVLLGRQGDEFISAEQMADWAGTINYEITTRIAGHIPRVAKPSGA